MSLGALLASGLETGKGMVVCDGLGGLTRDAFHRHQQVIMTFLNNSGIGPGKLVALALPRDRRMMLCVATIAATGAAWLPIDIEAPQNRARLILEDARPALVLLPDTDHLGWACGYEAWCLDAFELTPCRIAANTKPLGKIGTVPPDTAYVTYTSGTTGRPKGVIIPRKALLNFLHSIRETLDFGSDETLLAVTTWTFDIAVLEILLPLASGSRCVIASSADVRDPGRLTA